MNHPGTSGTSISCTILNTHHTPHMHANPVLDKDKEMPVPPVPPIETNCPKCHRPMSFPLPAGLAREDAERLAGLVLCNLCADFYAEQERPQARAQARLPYADD